MIWEAEDPEVMGPGWEERRDVREESREHWERRAAQWAALALAREIFGEWTQASLARYPSRGAFRGLLTLRVPFLGLEDHRQRELLFTSLAARDPVLEQVPLLFVFEPVARIRTVGR